MLTAGLLSGVISCLRSQNNMLKTINGSGRYVMVNGGMPTPTYITYSGLLGVGDIRYNSSTQNIEVYDGNNWIVMGTSHASVGLTMEAESLLDWAKLKKHEEENLKTLASTNSVIADLIEQKKVIDDQIKMVQILIKEEPKIGTN